MLLKIIESVKKRIKVIKKNKAFTLTELIAVIVILSILITLSVVVFMNIRRNILEKEYTNLVSYLETKAALYAKDTGITTISVEDLIKEGYIKPDDETDIYDPRDNKSMNCYLIKMEYKDGEYIAKLSDDFTNEDGTCKEYTKTSGYEICRINGNNCYSIGADEWFNENIKLGIKDVNGLINRVDASYSWSTNTGFTSNNKDVTTEVSLIGDITYKCEVKLKDETGKDIIGVATKEIKIDMEKPIISEIKYDNNYNTSKTIEIIATDGMGSGIGGYSIVPDGHDCNNFSSSNKIDVNDNGYYKVCVRDKAKNISNVERINIETIDKEYPFIEAKGIKFEIDVGTDNVILDTYFTVKYSKSGGTTTCTYGENEIKTTGSLPIGTNRIVCNALGNNGLGKTASTNIVVKPLIPEKPTIVAKLESASGSAYDSSWTSKNVYIDITPGRSNDIVTSYQYKIGSTGRWITPGNLNVSNNKGNYVINTNTNGDVYVRACNSRGCGSESNAKTIKIDKTAPTIKVKSTITPITIGTNTKSTEFFDVTYSISGGTTICTPTTTGSLAIGSHEISCTATSGSGLKSTAKFILSVIADAPSAPTIITKYRNANGAIYSGSWTNRTIYIGITAGSASDTITTYQYKFSTDSSWKNISWLSLNSDKSGSFTYSSEVDDTIYVRACNGSNCSGASNGKTIRIDTTPPDIWCDGSGAYMNHGGYTRTVSVSGCSAYATFRSGIESSSTFGQYVFNYSEGSLSTYITYYDDRGYSGSDADWRGSRGRCTSSYCSAVVTGCATDSVGNSSCIDFTYYVMY